MPPSHTKCWLKLMCRLRTGPAQAGEDLVQGLEPQLFQRLSFFSPTCCSRLVDGPSTFQYPKEARMMAVTVRHCEAL